MPSLSRPRAISELIFAAMLWGFGYIAVRWAMQSAMPLWINAIRFWIAIGLVAPVFIVLPKWRAHCNQYEWKVAGLAGVFLGVAMALQSVALAHTTVTKCSFISALYIVFVPLLEGPWLGNKVKLTHWIWVSVALCGAALMAQLEIGDWNQGDILAFLGAMAAALHIVETEKAAHATRSPFAFNIFQTVWAGVLTLCIAFPTETLPTLPFTRAAVLGLLALAFGSTLVAYTIQVRAQRTLAAPGLASLFFLLESPFAALFAYLLLGEMVAAKQWLGAGLISLGALGTLFFNSRLHPVGTV